MANRSFLKTGLLALCAFALSACLGGRSPSVQFYNLSATEPGSAGTELADKPAVAVGPAIFPKSLRRSQVVIRTGPNTVELDEFNRWAGSLSADFLDALGANLGARRGSLRRSTGRLAGAERALDSVYRRRRKRTRGAAWPHRKTGRRRQRGRPGART